jgi:hypothetical protein
MEIAGPEIMEICCELLLWFLGSYTKTNSTMDFQMNPIGFSFIGGCYWQHISITYW